MRGTFFGLLPPLPRRSLATAELVVPCFEAPLLLLSFFLPPEWRHELCQCSLPCKPSPCLPARSMPKQCSSACRGGDAEHKPGRNADENSLHRRKDGLQHPAGGFILTKRKGSMTGSSGEGGGPYRPRLSVAP